MTPDRIILATMIAGFWLALVGAVVASLLAP